MQPENSLQPTPHVEQLPVAPTAAPEAMPTLPPLDARFERSQERVEQTAEAGARASDAAVHAQGVNPVAPVAPPVANPSPPAPPAGISAPLVAADEDLIEKEWVDKAKEIINQTKDDPNARTQRVSELKLDYRQKRYGKVIGASE